MDIKQLVIELAIAIAVAYGLHLKNRLQDAVTASLQVQINELKVKLAKCEADRRRTRAPARGPRKK